MVVLLQESEAPSQDEERKHAGGQHGALRAEHTYAADTFATGEAAADAAAVEVDAAHVVAVPLHAAGVAVGVADAADVGAGVVAAGDAAEVVGDALDEPVVAHAADVDADAECAAVDAAGGGWQQRQLQLLQPRQLWEVAEVAAGQVQQQLIEPLVCCAAAELRLLQLSPVEKRPRLPLQVLLVLVLAEAELPLELEVEPPFGVDAVLLTGLQQRQEQVAWAVPHSGLAMPLDEHTVAGCVDASERSTADETSEHAGVAALHMYSRLDLDLSPAWQQGSSLPPQQYLWIHTQQKLTHQRHRALPVPTNEL